MNGYFDPGECLIDMHYGDGDTNQRLLAQKGLAFDQHISVHTPDAYMIMTKLLQHVTGDEHRTPMNKVLYVLQHFSFGAVTCAYQYDGRKLGLVTLRQR